MRISVLTNIRSMSGAEGKEACTDAKSSAIVLPSPSPTPVLLLHVGGPRLDCLVQLIRSALMKETGEIESLPSKGFTSKCKAYICIGINNVTRTLERMPHAVTRAIVKGEGDEKVRKVQGKARRTVSLQAVLIAIDVHPRLLASHLPGLASSRNVPCITISGGNGAGSLRLGEILGLCTAIAIGLKAGVSEVNKAIESFLEDEGGADLET